MSQNAQHTELGDISLIVGSYQKGSDVKNRYRNIGTLMQTEEADGQIRHWLKLNAEILSPALFTLCMRATAKKGDDRVTAAVFAPRDDKAPSEPRESYAGESDGID